MVGMPQESEGAFLAAYVQTCAHGTHWAADFQNPLKRDGCNLGSERAVRFPIMKSLKEARAAHTLQMQATRGHFEGNTTKL